MMAEEFEIARQATLEEVKQTVNETKTTIGDIGDPAGEESLVGLIKNIPETVPTGAVKSVQRGYHLTPTFVKYPGGKDVTIEINVVNPDKCFVILYPHVNYASGIDVGIKLKEVRSNQLVINIINGANATIYFSWQIIEFF